MPLRNYSLTSSSEVRFFTQIGRFAFFRPPLGDLWATYDDRLRLIGKRVEDFLSALIKLFSLGVTAEALRAIIGSKSAILFQRGPVDPKFQVEGAASHQPFFFSESYRFVTIHACDRRTNRRTEGRTVFSSLDCVCIACSAVKIMYALRHLHGKEIIPILARSCTDDFHRGPTTSIHGTLQNKKWCHLCDECKLIVYASYCIEPVNNTCV